MSKKNKNFISLHTHSSYSCQDGLGLVKDMLKACKEKGISSLAITDHGNCNAFSDLYLHAKEFGIKPIYGNEFYFVPDLEESRLLISTAKSKEDEITNEQKKEMLAKARKNNHITIIAKNKIGLKNLFILTYKSYEKGNFYYKPRIDRKLLAEHSEGLVCASGCLAGEIQRNIITNKWDLALEAAKFYKKVFGDDFYLEMQINEIADQKVSNEGLIKLSKSLSLPLIVTNDNHYINQSDAKAQQTLLLLQSKQTYEAKGDTTKNFWEFECKNLYLKNRDDMVKTYKEFAADYMPKSIFIEAVSNTLKVDQKIENIEIDTSPKLPKMSENPDKDLTKLCLDGLKEKGLSKNQKYVDRLKFELDIIKKKGFSNYFLVSKEIVSNAKKEMLVGPGRGSSAGSLVAYCLDITSVDPIRFDLLFDRFINLSRDDYPDIDTDFEDVDRAKHWIVDRFGEKNVALISTFGTFKMKGLIRDLGRVYGIPLKEVNALAKRIDSAIEELYPEENKSTLVLEFDKFYKEVPEFKRFMDKYPDLHRDFVVLHNQIRHVGKHAGGVIICDDLYEKMPTMIINDNLQTGITEGLASKNLGKLGFIKFDILGLSTLGIIHDTAKLVEGCTGKSKEEVLREIHPDHIDLEVESIYKDIFIKGRTAGVFQFMSDGMKGLIKESKVDCFEDLVAVTSLYRPGPLKSGFAHSYGEKKKNPKSIKYVHPILKEVLAKTHSLLCYQEQVMQIGHKLGGLSLTETNTLRKVIIKQSNQKDEKRDKTREELHQKFLQGSQEKGLTKEQASQIWDLMANFAAYGFCRAHAVSYSLISYQTAYLKYFYPQYFYTALLNSAIGEDQKLKNYLEEVESFGIKVLPVDINNSDPYFKVEGDNIRMGMICVKGVGLKAAENIKEYREKNQKFAALHSFFDASLTWRVVNQKVVSCLINIGAFDSFDKNRNRILESFKFSKKGKILKKNGSKFIASFDKHDDVKNYPERDMVKIESDLLGFNFFVDPFAINKRKSKIKMLKSYKKICDLKKINSKRRLVCIILDKKEIIDKNNNTMAFLRVKDLKGNEGDITVFASSYQYIQSDIKPGDVRLLRVKNNTWNDRVSVILNTGYDEEADFVKKCAANIDSKFVTKWILDGCDEEGFYEN